MSAYRRGDPAGGFAVPEGGDLASSAPAGKRHVDLLLQIPVCTKPVGPFRHRHRALGIRPQREAGDAKIGRLLLDAARVGDREAAVEHETHEGQVGEGIGKVDPGSGRQAVEEIEGGQVLARPWMDREDERQANGYAL